MILLATKKTIVVTITIITNVTTLSRFRPDAEDNQALFACEAHHPALQVENQHEQRSENDCYSGRCELPFSSRFSSRLRNQRSLATSRGRPSGSSSHDPNGDDDGDDGDGDDDDHYDETSGWEPQ